MKRVVVTLDNFSEEACLRGNPDIAEAVNAGVLSSGLDHFTKQGVHEDRVLLFQDHEIPQHLPPFWAFLPAVCQASKYRVVQLLQSHLPPLPKRPIPTSDIKNMDKKIFVSILDDEIYKLFGTDPRMFTINLCMILITG